jgi:L-fuconolactonase
VARGVRRLIQNQPDPEFVLRSDVIAATKLLPKYNLSFDLCIFHHQLKNTIAYVRACPDVFFIMDHIAKPGIKAGLVEPWEADMRELASLPNVVCKLSGVTTEADHDHWTPAQLKPYIDHVIDVFGFDRLMYGGDWPVSELAGPYTAWLDVLDNITASCSDSERRKLFRENAQKFYRLA